MYEGGGINVTGKCRTVGKKERHDKGGGVEKGYVSYVD